MKVHVLVGLAMLMMAMVGCRTPQPVLKPLPTPEVLNPPPNDSRFNNSAYPKAAFNTDDRKSSPFGSGGAGGVMPARGGAMGMPGASGMGAGGMGGPGGFR